MTDTSLPEAVPGSLPRHASPGRSALAATARAAMIGALAIGMTGFVLARELNVTAEASADASAEAAAETAAEGAALASGLTAPDTSTWDMRAEMAAVSSRDFLSGRQTLDGPAAAFSVMVDGSVLPVESNAPTLAEALARAGITVGADDIVSAPLGSELVPGQEITIQRVTGDQVTEEIVDSFETREVENDSMYNDQRRTTVEGVDGLTVTTYTTHLVDGEEASREVLATVLVRERVDRVIEVGTKERPKPPPPPPAPAAPAAPAAPRAYSGNAVSIGQQMAANRGWTGDQWSCLYNLWQKESNWNPNARNPSSGAHGIPQSLPGSKMASHGADWATNPATQIAWGLDYIAGRYGSPCGAWSHSVARNWY
ncbi:MAG: G5 domain-containing protein [bacterium]|nr:G5 domain-containing protein [bacterium]